MKIRKQVNIATNVTMTASGYVPDSVFDVGNADKLTFLIRVTNVSGTSPTMTITSLALIPSIYQYVACEGLTPTISSPWGGAAVATKLGKTMRLYVTIGGTTPSFTFTLDVIFEQER